MNPSLNHIPCSGPSLSLIQDLCAEFIGIIIVKHKAATKYSLEAPGHNQIVAFVFTTVTYVGATSIFTKHFLILGNSIIVIFLSMLDVQAITASRISRVTRVPVVC